MKFYLTYSYHKSQYELIKSINGSMSQVQSEILYEFDANELHVAEKIYLNLNRERTISDLTKARYRKEAA